MKTKIIPFDLEMAKKIQAGEIEGRIVTIEGGAARIVCFDKKTNTRHPLVVLIHDLRDPDIESVGCYTTKGEVVGDEIYNLCIELPEEVSVSDVETGDYVEIINDEHLAGNKGVAEIEVNTQVPFVCGVNQGKLGTFYVYDRNKIRIIKKHQEEMPKHVFKPFDKVLVTQNGWSYWIPSLYRNMTPDGHYICIDNYEYDKCIPYEGNEDLFKC